MNTWTISSPRQWPAIFKFLEAQALQTEAGKPRPLELVLRLPRRTNQQNRYLFGVVYQAFARGLMEKGKGPVDTAGLHYICAEQFLPRVPVGQLGKTRPMSTTELCKSGNENAFQDYVEQIKALAAHYGIYVPDPNEGYQ